MKLLFVISHPKTGDALKGLIGACRRDRISFDCFFTGEGVGQIHDLETINLLGDAEQAIVCEYSWDKEFPEHQAPIERGSQTDHSKMIGVADRVVSL